MFRRVSGPQLGFDIIIAVVAVALRFAVGIEPRAMAVAVLLFGAALATSRLSPALALGLAWSGAVIQMYAGATPDSANLAILVVLYQTARHGTPLIKWLGLGSAGVGALVAALYVTFRRPGFIPDGEPVFVGTPGELLTQLSGFTIGFLALLGLSWTLGLLVRTWTAAGESKRNQLAAESTVVVEQERNRIARDMHDVVAHSLAVVIAQADGARYAARQDPAATEAALGTIAVTAREALADVRLLLGQLRHDQEQGPQPVLADLTGLIDMMRASGLDVDYTETGEPTVPTPSQQLALYRITQEGLTNALRHGDIEAPVTVDLDWTADAAELTISNRLRGAAVDSRPDVVPGHGITGMRERALLVGGALTTAVDGGQYVVVATIPVRS